MTLPGTPWQSTSLQTYRGGDTYYYSGAPWILNDLDIGLSAADLTPDGLGNSPQRLCLSNWKGYRLVPKEATKFRVKCHLFRAVTNTAGVVDVTLQAFLPGHQNDDDISSFDTFCTRAFSNGAVFPVGSLPEGAGPVVEFPNIPEGDDWAVFYHQIRGTTPLGAGSMLRLLSFDVPSDYVLPASWPVPVVDSTLLMEFGATFNDTSSSARPVAATNMTLATDGAAAFNGTTGYLRFNGSDSGMTLDGDFTIVLKVKTSNKTMHGGTQRRIISFGGPPVAGAPSCIGMYINQTTGGVLLANEFVASVKTGAINIATGALTEIKWTRSGSTNTLYINGVQDGSTFTDSRSWQASSGAEIGRLNGQTIGFFDGNIYSIEITKGAAL